MSKIDFEITLVVVSCPGFSPKYFRSIHKNPTVNAREVTSVILQTKEHLIFCDQAILFASERDF